MSTQHNDRMHTIATAICVRLFVSSVAVRTSWNDRLHEHGAQRVRSDS